MIPHIVIVGADKGGVGKTTVSRTLLDYYRAHGIGYRAFDTETPNGVLQRFHPEHAKVVDLTKSEGQMAVFDKLNSTPITLIDIRAGLLTDTLRLLAEIGFLDGIREGKLRVTVLHVIGSTQASFNEIQSMAKIMDGARQFLVENHINESSYIGLSDELKGVGAGVIQVGKLDEHAAEFVDSAGVSFDAFVANPGNSEVLRGKVRSWLRRTFQAYDMAQLNAL